MDFPRAGEDNGISSHEKVRSMKATLVLASLAMALSSTPALADPVGDELADSACVALNFTALPPVYVAGKDGDITDPQIGREGLVYEEHGRRWLRWSKVEVQAAVTDAARAVYATCRIYQQAQRPDEGAVPSASFLVKVDTVLGPGEHWFAFRRNP